MSRAQPIEIITIYNVAQSQGGQNRIRLLAVLSLAVAAVWLWATLGPIDTQLRRWLLLAGISEATSTMPAANTNPWELLGLVPPTDANPMSREEINAAIERSNRHLTVLAIEMYTWQAIAIAAGAWLALASLLGVAGRRVSLRMQRQAAVLMILSTVASLAGIWIAVQYGGMPSDGPPIGMPTIAAVQSSYAWFLIIATRLAR